MNTFIEIHGQGTFPNIKVRPILSLASNLQLSWLVYQTCQYQGYDIAEPISEVAQREGFICELI